VFGWPERKNDRDELFCPSRQGANAIDGPDATDRHWAGKCVLIAT